MEQATIALLTSNEAVALYTLIVGGLLSTMLGLWIKNIATRWFALRRIRRNLRIGVGTVVERGTSVGSDSMVIREINSNFIILKNKSYDWTIPVLEANKRDWVINKLKSENDVML